MPIRPIHQRRPLPSHVVAIAIGMMVVSTFAVAADETAKYRGAASCQLCHGREEAAKAGWVQLNEYTTWHSNDAHAQAFAALRAHSEPMQRMRKGLGNPDLDQDQRCLACHAINTKVADWDPKFLPRGEEKPSPAEGVSCEVCHGPSSLWEEKHYPPSGDWKFLSSEVKQHFGMKDLRNPTIRAELCLSCHLGNVKEGRVVTHEMFAAGHPPLPGFEMQTFGQAMPSHWRRLSEKPEFRELAQTANYKTEAINRTDAALLGALIALRESTELLKDQSAKTEWPELSHYDCSACHHDLRRPSIRQERGYGGLIPGRPSMHQWPRALAELTLPPDENLSTLVEPVRTVLNRQPFGDRNTIVGAVDQVTTDLNKQIANFQSAAWHGTNPADWYRTHGKKLLAVICNAKEPPADLDSARQRAWLVKLIVDDAGQTLIASDRATFADLYASLDTALTLTIHSQDYNPSDPTLPRYWQQTLQINRNYNGQHVQQILGQIGSLLLPDKNATATAEP